MSIVPPVIQCYDHLYNTFGVSLSVFGQNCGAACLSFSSHGSSSWRSSTGSVERSVYSWVHYAFERYCQLTMCLCVIGLTYCKYFSNHCLITRLTREYASTLQPTVLSRILVESPLERRSCDELMPSWCQGLPGAKQQKCGPISSRCEI